jgi:hypothetical protein
MVEKANSLRRSVMVFLGGRRKEVNKGYYCCCHHFSIITEFSFFIAQQWSLRIFFIVQWCWQKVLKLS